MEGDKVIFDRDVLINISIHTLRMEGDLHLSCAVLGAYISIHTLRMEGDLTSATRIKAL